MADILIWGGTGQAKVLRPILERDGHRLALVFDRDTGVRAPFPDVPFLSDRDALERWVGLQAGASFAVAIGGDHGRERCDISDWLVARGLNPVTLVHERAWVSPSASLGAGCQVLAMAAVSVEARLGPHCIVNTNASVDHECVLGRGVHVMPGATLAGCVEVADYATIGSNATILPRVRIGERAMIGGGAVVTRDVPAHAVMVGVPARPRSRRPAP